MDLIKCRERHPVLVCFDRFRRKILQADDTSNVTLSRRQRNLATQTALRHNADSSTLQRRAVYVMEVAKCMSGADNDKVIALISSSLHMYLFIRAG